MTAEEALAGLGLVVFAIVDREVVDDRRAFGVVEAVAELAARQIDLVDLLRELDAWQAAHLDQLVDAPERRLRLARDEIGADAKYVDLVALLVERQNRGLVEVVAGDDLQRGKVLDAVLACYELHMIVSEGVE